MRLDLEFFVVQSSCFPVSGDFSRGETPVPIPNTVVKTSSADDTARETVWESRSLPGFLGEFEGLSQEFVADSGTVPKLPFLDSLETPQYFLDSHPQHDGAAVRAGERIIATEELIEKPLHFLLREGCVDLDGRSAGQADGNFLT